MIGHHYERYELLAYLDFNSDVVDVEAVGLHLSACEECGAELEDLRSLTAFLSDRSIYEFAAHPRRRVPRRRDIDDAAWRVRHESEEDDAAERVFQGLVTFPIEEWLPRLTVGESLPAGGLIRRLIVEAREELEKHPEQALLLLEVANGIARTSAETDDAIEHLALIAKESGNALRLLGRYPEALQSLDVSRALLSRLPAAAYDLTFVDWARATVLFCMTRYAEALTLVRAVENSFRQFSDTSYAGEAAFLEANILCEQGDVSHAHAIYSKLLAYFSNIGDREMVARLNANLAECEVRLDNPDTGRALAEEAIRAYEELGNVTERVRVRWTLGYSLLRQGYHAEALGALQRAAAEFETLGMMTDAAAVGLDVTELHVMRGEWREAERLARHVAAVFSAADAPVHKTHALAYLRDAVVARTATPDLLDYVRRYLADSGATIDNFMPPSEGEGGESKPV